MEPWKAFYAKALNFTVLDNTAVTAKSLACAVAQAGSDGACAGHAERRGFSGAAMRPVGQPRHRGCPGPLAGGAGRGSRGGGYRPESGMDPNGASAGWVSCGAGYGTACRAASVGARACVSPPPTAGTVRTRSFDRLSEHSFVCGQGPDLPSAPGGLAGAAGPVLRPLQGERELSLRLERPEQLGPAGAVVLDAGEHGAGAAACGDLRGGGRGGGPELAAGELVGGARARAAAGLGGRDDCKPFTTIVALGSSAQKIPSDGRANRWWR